MFTDIATAVLRLLGFFVLAPLHRLHGRKPRAIRLAVTFKLTDNDNRPLGGQTVRLFLGLGDPAPPDAGTTIVTDAVGGAAFTTTAMIDRRWSWVNVGFTGIAVPLRTDRLAVAAELEHVLLADVGEATVRLLCTLDIARFDDGHCSTQDFTHVYAADAQGRFRRVVDRRTPEIPVPGGSVTFPGMRYRVTDFLLDRETGDDWRLSLAFARAPKQIRYPAKIVS